MGIGTIFFIMVVCIGIEMPFEIYWRKKFESLYPSEYGRAAGPFPMIDGLFSVFFAFYLFSRKPSREIENRGLLNFFWFSRIMLFVKVMLLFLFLTEMAELQL